MSDNTAHVFGLVAYFASVAFVAWIYRRRGQ